ncbi:MAG: endonuclease MutS2 [Clostridiales bacterium]|jgi:DNA mismatch repair protein MutS2|nr:endonuclease MutS2 [Clostridiales bacterium]
MINEKTLKSLEYYKVLSAASAFAVNESAKTELAALVPDMDFSAAEGLLLQTEAAYKILYTFTVDPIYSFDSAVNPCERAKIGSSLSIRELLKVRSLCATSRRTKSALINLPDESVAVIRAFALRISENRRLEDSIDRCILNEEELKDDASPKLRTIRTGIRSCKENIKRKLAEYLHSSDMSLYLQDNLFTIRNDRYVLPVRSEYRSSVPGLLHDQSSSGATVFIEPMRIVELNNDLKSFLIDELYEIEKILASLSGEVADLADELIGNERILNALDAVFAKARYSEAIRAKMPRLNNERVINIKKGRHPLIDPGKVVPIDVSIGSGYSVLLISGPNTGGKTVTLKTIGLFTLMAAAGIFIPAEEFSDISVFENIFCDIGDEQSIELSLSTFSSHIKNIAWVVSGLNANSLVLFDELGAGTDPDEGAALAIAITDYIHGFDCRLVVTTHYSRLKEYYLDKQFVCNASMEFDPATYKPTYRIIMGVAGASNAIKIAETLGLPDAIIRGAADQLSEEKKSFEGLLSVAEARRIEAERLKRAMETDSVKLSEELKAASDEREKLFELRQALQINLKNETRQIARKAAAEAEELIEQMKGLLAEANEKNLLRLKQARNKLDEIGYEGDHRRSNERPLSEGDIIMGMKAYVNTLSKTGIITSLPNKKHEVNIDLGNMNISINVAELSPVSASNDTDGKKNTAAFMRGIREAPKMEINLLGATVAEAIYQVDGLIDSAILQGVTTLRIVHGMGTGALRSGLHKYFKGNKYIAEFRLGGVGEGSAGVTIVTLK